MFRVFCLFLVMIEFAECVEMVVDSLSKGDVNDVDENLFIDIAGLVHEGMKDIRKAVASREVRIVHKNDISNIFCVLNVDELY